MIETLVTAIILCNNQNWEHSERCMAPVENFTVVDGETYGTLTSGVVFTQKNVAGSSIRLQHFQMEDVSWYVSDRGVIEAESPIQALSKYLTR
jgi:tricorn protease-like protein